MEKTEEISGAGGGTGSPDVQRGLEEKTGQPLYLWLLISTHPSIYG